MQILSVLWATIILPPALLIVLVADTWAGRWFGLWALVFAITPWALIRARSAARWRKAALGLSVGWIVLGGGVLWNLPDGNMTGSHRAMNKYAQPGASFSRRAPGNWLPEIDQLSAGFTIMPAADRLFTAGQSAELKAAARDVYRELNADPDFAQLGSVMTGAYGELLGLPRPPAHSYVYVPAGLDRTKPSPVLVFFHGYGGNFTGYLWVLSKVADRAGCILVAPSNGLGNWRAEESALGFDRALQAAAEVAVIDKRRVAVAGLSNGGLAASQLARRRGSAISSLILISPVFDRDAIRPSASSAPWNGLKVLVISGDRDDRIPRQYVESKIGALGDLGATVSSEFVPDADHFLIFTHRRRLQDSLVAWLRQDAGKI